MHIALLIAAPFLVLILGSLLPHIDANPRVDGSEWRIKPSESGKTWEVYRYVGFLRTERFTRFKSPALAAAFISQGLAQNRKLSLVSFASE